jgi:signal transduction histidine kinase/CheY-like chemotaxis protein
VPGASRRRTVLVVEEDKVIRSALASLLRDEPDLTAVEAADGQEALRLLAVIRMDLVLLDLRPTDMTGVELIRQLEEHPIGQDAPVVATTSRGIFFEQSALARRAGYAVVETPFDVETLLAAVRAAIDTRGDEPRPHLGRSETSAALPLQDESLVPVVEQLLALPGGAVEPTLHAAANVVARALRAEKLDIWSHDAEGDSLFVQGINDGELPRRERALGMDRLPIAAGGRLIGVYLSGEPYITGRADLDPEVLAGFRDALGIRSMLVVPLEVAGQRRGVLAAASIAPDVFGDVDLATALAASRWVGMVLHRAELVEQVARDASERGRRLAAEELVTVLAHDLRNLIAPLLGNAQVLQRRAERDGRPGEARVTGSLVAAADRMRRMVDDLMDVARLERGLFAVSPASVDLVPLAEAVAAGATAGDRRVEVRPSGPEVRAHADPDRARQALENLVANAVQHTPSDTAILIEVTLEERAGGRWAVLTVLDEGPGVSAAVLDVPFSRDQSGHQSSGLGLGLYLARGIATAHGGSLTLDPSTVGARFRLALPADGA